MQHIDQEQAIMSIKDILREILIFFHLDITQNLKYDRLTQKIIKSRLENNFNCIDIGCHKGEILNLMLKYAPEGRHFGFEPIPYLFEELCKKFSGKAEILPYALSDSNGKTTFQLVKNAPAYSGIKKRRYDIAKPDIEEIEVELKTLDSLIPEEQAIHFIKIDVEGAEFGVLKGARRMLSQNKPVILFEFGKGASDFYGTNPLELFEFISAEIGLQIFTMDAYIKGQGSLPPSTFEEVYHTNKEYYFVAAPAQG